MPTENGAHCSFDMPSTHEIKWGFRASLTAGRAVTCNYTPSFVDGIGGKSVLAEMWPLVSTLLDGALVVSLEEVASAIRTLAQRVRVVAEGAGAASVAAALKGVPHGQRIVCVVSGGNLDSAKLARILLEETAELLGRERQ